MFKKENRLTTAHFKLFDSAKIEHTKNFFIKYTENKNSADGHRVAVAVSKKVNIQAVERNKIKRRIREALTDSNFLKPKHAPMLIVVHAKKTVHNLTQEEIRKELSCTQVFHSL